MATISRTWVFLLDAESLSDVGDSIQLNAAWNGSDGNPAGDLEWLQSTSGTDAERARGGTISWETMFGIPAGSVITDIQVTGYDVLRWADTGVTGGNLRTRIRFVDGAGVSATAAAGDPVDRTESTSAKPGVITAQGSSASKAVDAAFQPSSTLIALEIQFSFTESGTPNVDYEHDNIAVTVTYNPPLAPPPAIPQPNIHSTRSFA